MTQEKEVMDDYDSASNYHEVPGYVPVELILQHSQNGTYSIVRVEFPLTTKVSILKQDMEKRLKIPPERQEWFYKGVVMQPYDTMLHRRVKVDDKIVVKEITATGH
ncbi:hypothetical protein Bpfe_028748 [Biomphalaria pfeifferi]|uniref:Ubiquitin-like domain-containing protein n=1 Tax=Biomphalaria pfeifferi TaxID=112525 RepID=A0AAD8ASV0_BIOPF|nr:hypothetical protein Bpfe_028748 [Biomphalaria pfeifferi]